MWFVDYSVGHFQIPQLEMVSTLQHSPVEACMTSHVSTLKIWDRIGLMAGQTNSAAYLTLTFYKISEVKQAQL
jgi:hypothetical protein